MRYKKKNIIFVDDEPLVRKAVEQSLSRDFKVHCFASAHECLEALPKTKCDVLITDVCMPGISGIQLLAKVKRIIPALPVLIVTGYGNVQMAIRAMKAGAADFIEKPIDRDSLLKHVRLLISEADTIDPLVAKKLSPSERRVLRHVVRGRTNKAIALLLCRSVRTIEQHRRHILRKLNVSNLVELVKTASGMDLL